MDLSTAIAVEVRMSTVEFRRVMLTSPREQDLCIMTPMHNLQNLSRDSIGNTKACEEQILIMMKRFKIPVNGTILTRTKRTPGSQRAPSRQAKSKLLAKPTQEESHWELSSTTLPSMNIEIFLVYK